MKPNQPFESRWFLRALPPPGIHWKSKTRAGFIQMGGWVGRGEGGRKRKSNKEGEKKKRERFFYHFLYCYRHLVLFFFSCSYNFSGKKAVLTKVTESRHSTRPPRSTRRCAGQEDSAVSSYSLWSTTLAFSDQALHCSQVLPYALNIIITY